LDVLNEYKLQIMTPSYVADPAQPKVVLKEHWFDEPARSNGQQERRPSTP